jgi:hypothetical protein
MVRKRLFLTAAYSSLFLTLTACPPGQSSEPQADFYISSAGQSGVSGYLPNGYGWTPGSKVEISLWHEPDGPDSASTQWKKILDENVDNIGMFGFNSGAPFYPVRRTICGTPVQGQTMLAMAKNVNTGTIRMRQIPVDLYFTFQPCR